MGRGSASGEGVCIQGEGVLHPGEGDLYSGGGESASRGGALHLGPTSRGKGFSIWYERGLNLGGGVCIYRGWVTPAGTGKASDTHQMLSCCM